MSPKHPPQKRAIAKPARQADALPSTEVLVAHWCREAAAKLRSMRSWTCATPLHVSCVHGARGCA